MIRVHQYLSSQEFTWHQSIISISQRLRLGTETYVNLLSPPVTGIF